MRGKYNQQARPHLGPFVWNKIEKLQRKFSWVDEFAELLKIKNINKPIWLTEAMIGKCKVLSSYINAFANGTELIIDVGVNAPGMKNE